MLTCVSTARSHTKRVSAFWVPSGLRHFSCKFPCKIALVKCRRAFRLGRPAQSECVCVCVLVLNAGLHLGRGIFSWKFPYKMALVKCWCAFRLRRLAQSMCPRSGLHLGRGIFPVNVCIKWLLWNVDVHFDWAGSHKTWVRVLDSIWAAAFFL